MAKYTDRQIVDGTVYTNKDPRTIPEISGSDKETKEVKSALKDKSMHLSKNNASYNLRVNTSQEEPIEVPDGTRIRIIYVLKGAFRFSAQETSGKGLTAMLYSNINRAVEAHQTDGVIKEFTYSYTTSVLEGECNQGGYLVFSLCKNDSSAITDADRATLFANLYIDIAVDGRDKTVTKFDADYNLRVASSQTKPIDVASGSRIRLIYQLDSGFEFEAQTAYEKGLACTLYSNLANAVEAHVSQGIIKVFSYDYTKEILRGKSDVGGYLTISLSKTDGTNITDEQRAAMFGAIKFKLLVCDPDESMMKPLYLGEFVQGRSTATAILDDSDTQYYNYRIAMKNVVSLPDSTRKGRKIYIRMNPGFVVGVRFGGGGGSLDTNLYWYKGGDVISVPDGAIYYRVSLANGAGDAIDHTTVQISPVDDYNLKLYMLDESGEDIEPDAETDSLVSSAKYYFSSDFSATDPNGVPVIAHTSDPHGDYRRVKRFLNYCDRKRIDAACITGDIITNAPADGVKWFHDLVNETNSLVSICCGNHEVLNNGYTDQDVYDYFMSDISAKIGNATEKTWYYKDITGKNLRIISVNLYQYGGTSRDYTHFTSDQLSWLVSTLASTPANYGVIILSHSPQVALAKDANYPDFYQNAFAYSNTHNDVNGSPIYDIVDAFISRTTINQTYTQTGSPSSVTVTGDFTSVPATAEFIAHLTGHYHADAITYIPGTSQKQLMLNVTCGNALYGDGNYPLLANLSDIARDGMTAAQDSFNIYRIDRANKNITVIRVGGCITSSFAERKMMTIPYAD